MKSMARAILFGGIVAATAAVANSIPSPDAAAGADNQPADSSTVVDTYVEPQASEPVTVAESTTVVEGVPASTVEADARPAARPHVMTSVASAFPGSSDDAGYQLIAKVTHADLYGGSQVNVAWAFPGSSDDAGYSLAASRMQADLNTRLAQSGQRSADTSAE